MARVIIKVVFILRRFREITVKSSFQNYAISTKLKTKQIPSLPIMHR